MSVPCVRVPTERGEETRQALAADGLPDRRYEITAAEGHLYVPLIDPGAVPAEYEVVDRHVPARETTTTPADGPGLDPSHAPLGAIGTPA